MKNEYGVGLRIFWRENNKTLYDQEFYFKDKRVAQMVYDDIEHILDTLHLTLQSLSTRTDEKVKSS